MMSKLLTFVLIVTFIGCEGKEYKKKQNSNVDVVSDLNQGDSGKVIEKLESQKSLSPREKSYLASAYSLKGGIDVFSLYTVLEMQIFKKNALEWSDLSKEKNPYLKFMKSQENVDEKVRLKKREERWNAFFLPKLLERSQIELTKPTFEKLNESHSIEQSDYDAADEKYRKMHEKLMKESESESKKQEKWYEMEDKATREGTLRSETAALGEYYNNLRYIESRKQIYLHPEKAVSKFGGENWEMMVMNVLWNTYESIPVMKQLPFLDSSQQQSISLALKAYKELEDDKEFGGVALKNIIVLSSASILSIYKGSFSLDEVSSMQDLICTFEPKKLTDEYDLIRDRIIYLTAAMHKANFKSLREHRARLEEINKNLPEVITEEQKDRYFQGVNRFKMNKCLPVEEAE